MNKVSAIFAAPKDQEGCSNGEWEIIKGDAFEMLDRVPNSSCKLVVTSPPYNIGNEYERDERLSLPQYVRWLNKIVGKLCDKVTPDGHICWQSGNFVEDGEVFPLDTFFYRMFTYVNAFLITMRKIIEDGGSLEPTDLKKSLTGISSFDFKAFHSSQYNRMAEKIYDKHFA